MEVTDADWAGAKVINGGWYSRKPLVNNCDNQLKKSLEIVLW